MLGSSELQIRSSRGRYDVHIGDGLFQELLQQRRDTPIIADEFFADLLGTQTRRTLFLAAREDVKTLSSADRLIGELRDHGAGRDDTVIAVGGGIVQDVATLVTSLYMRGLAWSYVPTTLLAMADSCIGGKSSINVGPYKNLAGNFHAPELIVIDPTFVATLSAEDRAGGLCEAMKISFCRGSGQYGRYLELVADVRQDGVGLAALLSEVLASKQWFIEIDEFDRAERRQLNFGHTFAHALEAATGFGVSHGIAVGIGVVAAERLAVSVDGESMARPELVDHAVGLVRQAPDLAERLENVDIDRFEAAFRSDKKHGADGLHVIVPSRKGATEERVLGDDTVTMGLVVDALTEAIRMVTR